MDKTTFPSLKDRAFEVFYKELLLKATHPTIVDFVRDGFGTMEKTLKQRCINELNPAAEADTVFAVLDCVLDDRFKELKVRLPVSSELFLSFSKLLSIVASHSPRLEQLEVCAFHSETTSPAVKFEDARSNDRLMCLKKLVLCNDYFLRLGDTLTDATNRSIFSLVGEFCPALTELKVDGFFPKKKDYIGLVLGELADIVLSSVGKKWIEDQDFENLRVSPGFKSSLCSTIQKLIIEKGETTMENCFSITDRPTLIFVLRNMPELILVNFEDYTVAQHECFVDAIKFLRDHRDIVDGKEQKEFDQVCGEAASRRRNAVTSPLSHSGIGTLSLQTISYAINSDDLDSLRATGQMCPHLKHITFDGELLTFCDALKSKFEKELKVVLDGWTQAVESIRFEKCDFSNVSFMVPVLKTFAPSLKILHFEDCVEISMTALAVCNQLEELTILLKSTLHLEATDPCSYLTPNIFLPSLKKLNCNVLCLGIWSPLLEVKSKLTDLTLNCCHHIKTNAEAWTNLQTLEITDMWYHREQQCELSTLLSTPTIFKMIPQMKSLRSISLPRSMMLIDPQVTQKVTQDLASRKIPFGYTSDPSIFK